jgi:FdhE protein
MNDNDRLVLQALAAARTEHRELAGLLDFYYELYETQFEAKGRLPAPGAPDPLAARERLEEGIPQLSFTHLCLEPETFASVVARVTEVFLHHNPRWKTENTDWHAATLVRLAEHVFELRETQAALWQDQDNPDWPSTDALAALVVSLGLVPYLQLAAESVMPCLDLSVWLRGYCPICGAKPNLALLDGDSATRQLMCSRCASLWTYGGAACPYCGDKEHQTYYLAGTGLHRLYICSQCKRYLKAVDLQKATTPIQPVVEHLLTLHLDLAAQQQGWRGIRFSFLDDPGHSPEPK